MSTIIGGVTVKDPIIPTTKKRVFNGEYSAAINGGLLMDGTGKHWKWTLDWKNMTPAEYNTLMAVLDVESEQTFSPPEESTVYNAMVLQDTVSVDARIADGAQFYDVTVDIEESS